MKIAIVVSNLNVRGGTHKQVLRLVEYLTKKGNDVTIYTYKYDLEKTYCEFSNYKIVSNDTQGHGKDKNTKRKGKVIYKISSRINNWKTDVHMLKSIPKDTDIINIHDHGLERLMFLLQISRKGRLVWQINDLPICYRVGNAANVQDSFKMKVRRFFTTRIAKGVDALTVNVTKNKERVKEHLRQDAKVFYCGVDVNDKLKKHNYLNTKNTIRLLSTGVFFKYRNYEALIEVVYNLRNKGINIYLDIIGSTEFDQEYSTNMVDLIRDKKLDEYIKIWGQVDDSTYNALYNQADIFAFVNIDQSWGLAVFEAMSCGLPVIVSNSVGAIELLHNGKDSIILEPTDVEAISKEIMRLSEDESYYKMISENAFMAVKEFTWDNLYSSKMLEIFNELA